MKINPFVILVFASLCLFISCSEKHSLPVAENIEFEQVYIPVIQGETATIAYLNFNLEKEEYLRQLEVEMASGTTIENVSVTLVGEEEQEKFINGVYDSKSHLWRLKEEIVLEKGEQQLAIKVTIPEDADLKSKFSLNIPLIEIGKEKCLPDGLGNIKPWRQNLVMMGLQLLEFQD